MIRVTVELIPHGTGRPWLLGTAEITNDGTLSTGPDSELGSYDVRLSKWVPKSNQTWKRSRVESFKRKSRGLWDLLYLALGDCVGDRNKQCDTVEVVE